MWLLHSFVAIALGGTGEPAFDVQEGRPHCFPLSIGVAALAELDRITR